MILVTQLAHKPGLAQLSQNLFPAWMCSQLRGKTARHFTYYCKSLNFYFRILYQDFVSKILHTSCQPKHHSSERIPDLVKNKYQSSNHVASIRDFEDEIRNDKKLIQSLAGNAGEANNDSTTLVATVNPNRTIATPEWGTTTPNNTSERVELTTSKGMDDFLATTTLLI